MNSKSILILGALTLVAGAAAMWSATSDTAAADSQGALLLPELAERRNDVVALTVTTSGASVELALDGESWGLPGRHSFPVNFGRVKKNVLALSELRVLEKKTRRPERHALLGLEGPESEGSSSARLQARDSAGEILAEVIVGNSPEGATDAVYVRLAGEEQCYLSRGSFELLGGENEWIETQLLELEDKDVQSVSLAHADGELLRVTKPTPEEYNYDVQDVPEGRELQYAGIGGSVGRLANYLSLDDFRPIGEVDFALDPGVSATVSCFDGLEITIHTSVLPASAEEVDGEGTTWIRIAADVAEPAEGEARNAAAVMRATKINLRHANWAYSIASYSAANFNKRMVDMLKELEEPEVGPPAEGPDAAAAPADVEFGPTSIGLEPDTSGGDAAPEDAAPADDAHGDHAHGDDAHGDDG